MSRKEIDNNTLLASSSIFKKTITNKQISRMEKSKNQTEQLMDAIAAMTARIEHINKESFDHTF